jgi:hypothetical protein
MWMVMPSPVCITVGFHALTWLEGRELDAPLTNCIERETTLFTHGRDFNNRPTPNDLQRAAKLFETLSTVPRKNAVWPALRPIWGALTAYPGDMRYPLFWQAMESLFGSETDMWQVSKRLRERISYFLAADSVMQAKLEAQVKACYAKRSDIVHAGAVIEYSNPSGSSWQRQSGGSR